MKTTIVMALAMMAIALRTVEAQCYQFSSGATASLTVNITHLPPPTMPQPGIYQYTSSSGLAGDISLTVGQTTYTPVSSIPVSFDITVSSDATLNFSVLDLSVGFTTANQTVAAASLSVDWSAALFPNGTLPAAL
ncbi:MAG TPA: hypothetical protein VMH81_36620, partial [Bryobacteraceae bacterium]|nr:hypothetical protein [Bryobacteraceae bacterium]